MTTLDFERSGIAGAISLQQSILSTVGMLRPLPKGDPRRGALAALYIGSEVARQMSYHIASKQDRGMVPNYEASMAKLFSSELSQRLAAVTVNATGLRATLLRGSSEHEFDSGRAALQLMFAIPRTIAGGSSEVQRGIIATRGLGLPRG